MFENPQHDYLLTKYSILVKFVPLSIVFALFNFLILQFIIIHILSFQTMLIILSAK
jgi:hypothetical protein